MITAPVSPKSDRLPLKTIKPHHPTGLKVGAVAALIFLTITVTSALVLSHAIGLGPVSELALKEDAIGGIVATVLAGGLFGVALAKCYWAARTKENLTFEKYVEKRCKIGIEKARRFAEIGRRYFTVKEGILDDDIEFMKKNVKNFENEWRKGYKIAFVWYLMRRALNAKQGFEKGMIVFNDKDHQIHDFFADAAYERNGNKSSHFKKERETSYGIDIPEGLPYVFKHVHFGKLKGEEDYTFLKLEQFGLNSGLLDKAAHFLDLCRTTLARAVGEYNGPNERKEKRFNGTVKKMLAAPSTPMEKLSVLKEAYPYDREYLQYRKGDEVFINLA